MSGFFIGAIDLGTTSTRVIIYDEKLKQVSSEQAPYSQIHQEPGWTEQKPNEVWVKTRECLIKAYESAQKLNKSKKLLTIGITNQRETTLTWDSKTGEPLTNAIVWHDKRTSNIVDKLVKQKAGGDKNFLLKLSGLPLSTYFSALKLKWMIENVDNVKKALDAGTCMFGTFDSWLIWKFTGGLNGGSHVTDVTNASRTMLMNIQTLKWDLTLLKFFDIPVDKIILPEIRSCSEDFGTIKDKTTNLINGIPIHGCIGDQQSATLGQECFEVGSTKNTYGTGGFLLMNIGKQVVYSKNGLVSTVCFQLGKKSDVYYALEGSTAVCGSGIEWVINSLGLVKSAKELCEEAEKVKNTGGVYFVPSFTGLFAPYWDSRAKGTIVGLSFYTKKQHILRALLEGICFRSQEVMKGMQADSGVRIAKVKVDGGVSQSDFVLQIQANLSNLVISRGGSHELTARGAAIAAGFGKGIYKSVKDIPQEKHSEQLFKSNIKEEERKKRLNDWKFAISAARFKSAL